MSDSDAFYASLNNEAVLARIAEISARIGDLSPAMLAIGEALTESTKERFDSSTAPDGTRWKPNSQATVLSVLNRISGAYTKKGKISAKGTKAAIGKRPLVDTGLLQDTIRYQLLSGGNGVEIGTNRFSGEWAGGAAVHQWGSQDGKIPARPFLGLSGDDEATVLDILGNFGSRAIG